MKNKATPIGKYRLGLVKTAPTKAAIRNYLVDAKSALSKVNSIQDAISIKSATKAIEELTKQVEIAEQVRLDATELRIRAERALGLAIQKMPKIVGTRGRLKGSTHGSDRSIVDSPESNVPTLEELGVSNADADRCRELAKLSEETFESILTDLRSQVTSGERKILSVNAIISTARQQERGGLSNFFSPLIKPSDNWNFCQVKYGRIDDECTSEDRWGYIPGEIYANCFWYYVKPGNLVIAPMAGAGQVWRVYEARHEWMGQHVYDFDLKMFDLTPRGKYKHLIGQHNLTKSFPIGNPDYIVMDVPYYGMVAQQYSNKPEDLANMTLEDWKTAMSAIAKNCAAAQRTGTYCTVISSNYRDVAKGVIVMVTDIIRQLWESAGYTLYDKAYSSRRIQQNQTPNMARMNNHAKANRIMLTDITEILTFRRV